MPSQRMAIKMYFTQSSTKFQNRHEKDAKWMIENVSFILGIIIIMFYETLISGNIILFNVLMTLTTINTCM